MIQVSQAKEMGHSASSPDCRAIKRDLKKQHKKNI